jgi:nucleotide-binding universal stress UspA family protein
MAIPKHILVPTDGSESSLKAATFAGDFARAANARVTVLTILDQRSIVAEAWNASLAPADAGIVDKVRGTMEEQAEQNELAKTKSAVGDVPAGVESVQVWGHPSDDILSYAEQNGVDLIVMGSHGRSAIQRALLGSVSNAVVNSAGCAVTVVR